MLKFFSNSETFSINLEIIRFMYYKGEEQVLIFNVSNPKGCIAASRTPETGYNIY